MLKNKVSNTLGISGPGRVACQNDFGWNRWGRAQDMGNEWAPLCCLLWASLELVWGRRGPRQTASDLWQHVNSPRETEVVFVAGWAVYLVEVEIIFRLLELKFLSLFFADAK